MKPHEYVILEVARERERQMTAEGWSPEHDDREHRRGELAMAAASYAAPKEIFSHQKICNGETGHMFYEEYPFNQGRAVIERQPRRRQLIIAAALIVAEIERLDRIDPKESDSTEWCFSNTPTPPRSDR